MKSIYDKIVEDIPLLKRGIVYCHKCGKKQRVDSAYCLAKGWPKHCGETMSIDPVKK